MEAGLCVSANMCVGACVCVCARAHKCFEHGGAKERHLREAACHSAVMLIDMSVQMEREVETYRGDHERRNEMKLRDNFFLGWGGEGEKREAFIISCVFI